MKNREELIARLEQNCPNFYVSDGTLEDIGILEKEYNYDYDRVYEAMVVLLEIMYEEN